jgi:hypothetical protein
VTPEKIVRAMELAERGKPARVGPGAFPEIPWGERLQVPPPWEGGDGNAINEKPRKSKPSGKGGREVAR